ncbi:TlpA family protein disulfide reductase [Streptomyces sp. SID6673]|uniref:TlpA family protein disulfide reductase n=2 Tax=Gordonia hankookensis TaxID=589403 RepID=A0ABR7WIF5_9ACTN|nr:TlpA family protein disulfide reductase [Gordonia hankookensis]NDZ97705.1 TlpA family protein disulfide reductase [Streptomyces sp. SID11726]NEB26824.1 TlpA family protein disulfide reductase [Streptomyces sp. SID6673]
MIALVVAIWPRGDDDTAGVSDQATATGPKATDAQVDEGQLAQARRDAALQPCPQTGLPIGPGSVLAGVTAPCLADGKPYDVGAGTAGKPMVVNMWAVWCLPCRRELPEMAAYAQRAGDKVTVLAVHAQEGAKNPYLALRFLTENNVHLPVVMDPDARIAGALKAPRVFPSTILVRGDGTVAKVLPQVFDDPDQIAAAVRQYLGVAT